MNTPTEERYRQYDFTITYDALLDDGYNIDDKVQQLIEETYFDLHDRRVGTIRRIKKYIALYPHLPQFKNHLYVAYKILGKHQLARQINRLALEKHPEYFFAFINEANDLISIGALDKAEKLLDGYHSIQDWAPERKVFHVSEFSGFETAMIYFLLAKGNLEAAESRFAVFSETPDLDHYGKAESLIEQYKTLGGLNIKKQANTSGGDAPEGEKVDWQTDTTDFTIVDETVAAMDKEYYDPPEQAVSYKIGRNEPCPCGSGKKYKKCCEG